MRGTSTDVSRYDGEYEHVFKSTTAGVTIQAPQLDIDTVAARPHMLLKGDSPNCDANLCLGRLLPENDWISSAFYSDLMVVLFPTLLTSQAT
ncbi:unnamed protein product [Clavelina lepadiformis]|uniref:Hydantoinase A/oxoprolinase domain-containing protein n=1 Tax=Clavelina lepadiformis TaxID=159417 RepID=A0ABP0G6K1_CLALP